MPAAIRSGLMQARRRARRRALCFAVLAVAVAGCGSNDGEPAMHVNEGVQRLASLIRERGVALDRSASSVKSIPVVWDAFKEFAAVPVESSELRDDAFSDGLLVEFGVFESGGDSGRTLQLILVRQLATDNGDLQQVRLVAHLRPADFDRIRRRLRVEECGDRKGCPARCAFENERALVGAPCVVSSSTGRLAGSKPPLASVSAWSFDTGGSSTAEQRESWIAFVERSPLYREARKLKPLAYEVSQESAE